MSKRVNWSGVFPAVTTQFNSALTRPPRLALQGEDRANVERIMAKARANRPALPDVGL